MHRINPNHQNQKNVLRVVGPAILVVALGFIAVGMISFFSAFGGNGRAQYFWCIFVGMPLLFVGLVLCKFAFMGKVARYAAGELAPVGRDTFNYMASETQEGFSNLSRAISEGVQEAKGGSIGDRIRKLEELRRSGVITDEDFEKQKNRILSEL